MACRFPLNPDHPFAPRFDDGNYFVSADAIAIHGHVYQPPRADPRTGYVPVEPTAAPFHDWNARITAECYRPNVFARIYDEQGRVERIVNNYGLMSFNLGPTLAHWLDDSAPDVLARMTQGDRAGHTAIAHPFHHAILALCPSLTPAPSCAGVGPTSATASAANRRASGCRRPVSTPGCSISSPPRASGSRSSRRSQVASPVPPGAVGRWQEPGGRELDLVVYDGGISHDIAFGGALHHTGALVDRLASGADGGLVVAATDAETFGHHHRFTERAIAHALGVEAPARGIRSGGLAGLLDLAPRVPVDSVWPSAWSCAHGLGRWRGDCGCSTDGEAGWHQRWREPLRDALVLLRAHSVDVFARRGVEIFHDPWAARDAFGDVLADPDAWDDFVDAHVRPNTSEGEARALLDSQEATLASFTSCAWFFADLARREVAIVLQEALRSIELLRSLGEDAPLAEALDTLALAESNDPALPTGRDVWSWATDDPAPSDWRPSSGSAPLDAARRAGRRGDRRRSHRS